MISTQMLVYVISSAAAMSWRNASKHQLALAASLAANGVLIVAVGTYLRVHPVFGWLGLSFLFAGIAMFINMLFGIQPEHTTLSDSVSNRDREAELEMKKIISAIQFPTALLESHGHEHERVVAANEALAAMLGTIPEKMEGALLSSLLSMANNSATLKLPAGEWAPHRSSLGNLTLFMLSPPVKTVDFALPEPVFIDADTGIYNNLALGHLAPVLLNTCRKFNRTLCALLLNLDFENKSAVRHSEEIKWKARLAFGKIVSMSVPDGCMAFSTSKDEITVLLPDFSSLDIKTLIDDIHDKIKKIATIESAEVGLPRVSNASFCWNSENIPAAESIAGELRIKLNRDQPA
jgi:GGDEF domain-containing protein